MTPMEAVELLLGRQLGWEDRVEPRSKQVQRTEKERLQAVPFP